MKTFILSLFGTVILLIAGASHAQQSVDATITGGVVRPLAIAIPDFNAENGIEADLAANIVSVIASDLRSTGLFRDLPAGSYLEGAGAFGAAVNFSNWSGIGAEAMVKGSVAQSSDGQIRTKFRVFDVISQSEIAEGMQFNGATSDWRRIAHKISDSIYSRITGEGAYFDSRVVFVSESGPKANRRKALAIMDSDGANLRYLTDGNSLVLAPRFSSNNRDIIYTSYASGLPQVVMMNTFNGSTKVLGDLPGLAFSPRFSPRENSLVVSLIDDGGNTDLYQIDLGSGARTRLTSEPSIETSPSFSPDGSKLVFESDRSGSQQIYVMPASGGAATKISKGSGRYATPVWSPRGDLIAFTKIEGGQFHIGVMGTDGSGERILTTSFLDEGPTWAPNGRVLMFFRETAGVGGAPKLFSISLTGQNMVQVGTPDFASDPSWSNILE